MRLLGWLWRAWLAVGVVSLGLLGAEALAWGMTALVDATTTPADPDGNATTAAVVVLVTPVVFGVVGAVLLYNHLADRERVAGRRP